MRNGERTGGGCLDLLILTPLEIGLATAVVLVAACVQGSIGFGMALVAAPLLVLISPELVPGPIIANAWVLTLLVTYRERGSVAWPEVRWALLGCALGTVCAGAVISVLSPRTFSLVFAGLVLLAVVLSAVGKTFEPKTSWVVSAGGLGGFMGTLSSIGGPPLALVFQGFPGPKLRGTLGAYFSFSTVLALGTLAVVGRFGSREAVLALLLIPGLLAGFALSGWTAGVLDRGSARPAVLLLCTAAAGVVLVRAFLSP